MTPWNSSPLIFAQEMISGTAAIDAAPPVAWYQQGWFIWLVALALIGGSYWLATTLARAWRMNDYTGRFFAIIFSTVAGLTVVFQGWYFSQIKMGIDLVGGVSLIYELDSTKLAVKDLSPEDLEFLKKQIGQVYELAEVSLTTGADGRKSRVVIDLPQEIQPALEDRILLAAQQPLPSKAVLQRQTSSSKKITLEISSSVAGDVMNVLVNSLNKRINPGGQKEIEIRKLGLNQVGITIPQIGVQELQIIKEKIGSAGTLEFRILANVDANGEPIIADHKQLINYVKQNRKPDPIQPDGYDYSRIPQEVVVNGQKLGRWLTLADKADPPENRSGGGSEPVDIAFKRAYRNGIQVLVAEDIYNITGEGVKAGMGRDEKSRICVTFTLPAGTAGRFDQMTNKYTKSDMKQKARLAVILDDELQTAPTLNSRISGGQGIIQGSFTEDEVSRIVGVLNSGQLPVTLNKTPVQENIVSSQLGQDTIVSGSIAMLFSTLAILIFMAVFYRFCGLVANFAVLLNMLLVVALMIPLKAAFTLAGLAGLVLSVGMAVDANVLIFERIREELARGSALRMAIRNGFSRAMSTVVDSNLTTLVTAVVMFAIGSDQLRGFATTLILGLGLNLFTAVYCSRVVFDVAERRGWVTKLNMMRLLGETKLDFVKPTMTCVTVSLLLIALGLFVSIFRGRDLFDIDFNGGSTVQVVFNETAAAENMDVAEIRKIVSASPLLPDVQVSKVENTGGRIKSDMYKIVTGNEKIDEVKQELGRLFAGKLDTYYVSSNTATAYVPPVSAVTPKLDSNAKLPIILTPDPAKTDSAAKTDLPAKSATPTTTDPAAETKAAPEGKSPPAAQPLVEKVPAEKAPPETSAEKAATPDPAPAKTDVPAKAETKAGEPPNAPEKGAPEKTDAEKGTTPEKSQARLLPRLWRGAWPTLLAAVLQTTPLEFAQADPPAVANEKAAAAQAAENKASLEKAAADNPPGKADAAKTDKAEAPAADPGKTAPATAEKSPPGDLPPAKTEGKTAPPAASTTIPPAAIPPAAVPPATPPLPTDPLSTGLTGIAAAGEQAIRSVITLSFARPAADGQSVGSNPITRENLLEIFNSVIKEKNLEVTRLDFKNPDLLNNTMAYETWTVESSLTPPELTSLTDAVKAKIGNTPIFPQANVVGGKVAGDTQGNAIWALVVSMLAIVLYVWFRFQNVVFGFAAVIALIHDVLVTVAFIAFSSYLAPYFGWAMVDPFKISLNVVAALLTIVGFSINDTIVIFDRIRETRGKSPDITADMVNKAVNQTLGRTILTSGTVLMVTIILYVFGGEEIHPFSFAMLIGLISGTYSTVYIAAPLVLWFRKKQPATAPLRSYGGTPARRTA